jgi:hypothetical protein
VLLCTRIWPNQVEIDWKFIEQQRNNNNMSPASRKRSGSVSSISGAMKGATSARTAAIQAVERRRRQEEHDNPNDNHNQNHNDDYQNYHNTHADSDSPPPLLEEPDNSHDAQQQIQQQQQQQQMQPCDIDSCLHCHSRSADIQVRCDECQSYICQTCHWCHEFQANHEIRVCDRCDAFYCRTCDEMDQCDDCGEVVCASCSTLLSCKFCGGGLCEECATACGRYVTYSDYLYAIECGSKSHPFTLSIYIQLRNCLVQSRCQICG